MGQFKQNHYINMGTCRYDKNKIQDAMKMTNIWGSVIISVVLKVGSRNPGKFQRLFQVVHSVKTMIIIILRHHLLFSLLISFKGTVGFSQRLHDIWDGNGANAEADMRIQLSLLS